MLNLAQEIELAAQTVYQLDQPTSLDLLNLPDGRSVYIKREDQSAIHSYKWRGAFHKMVRLLEAGNHGPFVTTSAGNHAQGVAAGAKKLKVQATIFMPIATPTLKQRSVLSHGGKWVEVILVGDSFDDAQSHALRFARENCATVLPAFDDPQVVAGQATVGLEILEHFGQYEANLDMIFVPIGGGGLASGVAAAIKSRSAEVQVIGVEVEGQDAMRKSIAAGRLVSLEEVDRFCDGTAVASPGKFTFAFCKRHLDDLVTVTNNQVCQAIQIAWEQKRLIPEPSGAIALAGFLNHSINDKVAVAIVSGSNTDFMKLPSIAQRSRLSQPTRRYFQFEIAEQCGALIGLLDQLMDGINIIDFQYGKTAIDSAQPVVGFMATKAELEEFVKRLGKSPIVARELSGTDSVDYRVIPFQPELVPNPYFLRVDFPDRPGALRKLMRRSSSLTNICYFNFQESGESEGHALIGFEFSCGENRQSFFEILDHLGFAHRQVDTQRLLGFAIQ